MTVNRDLRNEVTNGNSLPDTITDSRGQERPATYRKPEPPHTVNTDTGEIVPVVGAGYRTVQRDIESSGSNGPDAPRTVKSLDGVERTFQPRPEPPHTVNTDTGEIVPSAAERQAAHDAIAREANAIENVAHMTDTLRRLASLRTPEYRARLIENNAAYPDREDPAYTQHFNPQGIRDLADLLNTLATEMENAS